MRDWIVQNGQWLFSGAGISIIGASLWLLKKLFRPQPKTPQPAPINNSVVQSPVISVAPVFHLPHHASPPPEPTPSPPPTEEIDPRPKLYTLSPRIINVTLKEIDETGNQYDLRRRYVNLLIDYYDKKWKRVDASQFGSTERENFWLLDQL
jgi:hypothetical protein